MFSKFCLRRHILQVSTSKLSPITVVMSHINFVVIKTQLILREISYGIIYLQRKLILFTKGKFSFKPPSKPKSCNFYHLLLLGHFQGVM